MNIFISQSLDPKILGIAQGLEYIYPTCSFWNKQNKPLFELIEDDKPSLIFLLDDDVKEGHWLYAKHDHPEIKFIWLRRFNLSIDNSDEIDLIIDLNEIDYLINTKMYLGGKKKTEYESLFTIIDEDMRGYANWINSLGYKYQLKVYGKHKVDSEYYLGNPHINDIKNIIVSSKAIITFTGEWTLTAIANGITPIYFGRKNQGTSYCYKELENICDKFVKDGNLAGINQIDIRNKTYKDLAIQILEGLKA